MKKRKLSVFDYKVLIEVVKAEGPIWAKEIKRRLEKEEGREVPNGTFYSALWRLKRDGLVDALGDIGGKDSRERYFEATEEGKRSSEAKACT